MNLPKKNFDETINQNINRHSLRKIALPLILTVLFIIVYTFILQKNFSDETLRSGLERNTNRSDSTSELLADVFTRDDFTEFRSTDDMDKARYHELQNQIT